MNFKPKALLAASMYLNKTNLTQAVAFAKDNWREIAIVVAGAYVMEDLDTAAEMAETSAVIDILTASSEGVI
mgnify:FL=1|jgi:hypothetical protein|tara:strand:- start:72 stop:287 length:216 start_codon:yes stop_codon:yes gene_type:complete